MLILDICERDMVSRLAPVFFFFFCLSFFLLFQGLVTWNRDICVSATFLLPIDLCHERSGPTLMGWEEGVTGHKLLLRLSYCCLSVG